MAWLSVQTNRRFYACAWLFLKAANHQVIGTSKMYASAAFRDGEIESMKTNGMSASVKDNT